MLTATLIVRDEARCIARCLQSVRPWVDRMVVLDTGSVDDTPVIAHRLGAELHGAAWPGDFSAARNHALDLADADWNLIIDADEWIEGGGEELRAFCAGPPRLGRLRIDSALGDDGASARSWITRLLPRGVRFAGRVHEQAVSDLPRERVAAVLGHDGYREVPMAAKRGRNRPLLLLDLADNPGDPYTAFQLGREAEGAEDFAEAADWYAQALSATPAAANWHHELLVRQLHSLGQAGRREEALGLAWEWMEVEAMARSPDFFFTFGNLLLDQALADPAQAIGHWLPLAGAAWERCLDIGERPDLEGSVAGRGSHLARHNLDLLRGQLG